MLVRFTSLMGAASLLTTVDAISNTLLVVLGDPALRATLLDNPARVASLVEESVRLESPVAATSRTVAADTRIGGKEVAEGQRVLLLWGAGNRDGTVFPDADRVVLGRRAPHLGWGAGPHACPGRHIATMTVTTAITTVLTRLPGMALVGTPGRTFGALRGVPALPVVWP